MRVVTLIENTEGARKCEIEHGLSLYIENEKNKILFDTGATGKFIANAKTLGIDLLQVEQCILSHGHYDHAGGILPFAERNKSAKIIIHQYAKGEFFHKDQKEERYIGIDKRILELPQVEYTYGNVQLNEQLYLFTVEQQNRLWPKGNQVLAEKCGNGFVQDEFLHEQYLVISEGDYKILVSGCAHKGIVNIIEKYKTIFGEEPQVVISGFHMRKKEGYTKDDIELIEQTARELCKYHTKFYTGHCTGEEPYLIMKDIMGEQLAYLHSGDEIII